LVSCRVTYRFITYQRQPDKSGGRKKGDACKSGGRYNYKANMKSKIISVIFISLQILSCSYSNKEGQCKLTKMRTIFFDATPNSKYGNVYAHYILINDFSKSCMDSSTMVKIALKYCDTVKEGRPVNVIKLFSSDKDFIANEHSQVMEKINKSCLFSIGINLKTNKPDRFIFYNDQGEIIYIGEQWKKNGIDGKPLYK